MAQEAEIKLKVTSEIKGAAQSAGVSYKGLKDTGAFDSKAGQRQAATAAAAAKQIENLSAKEELTKNEAKQLKSAFDVLYRSMINVTKATTKMTPALEKALQEVEKAQQKLETRQKALNTLNKKGQMTDSGFKLGQKGRNEVLRSMGVYKASTGEDGSLRASKVQITNEESLDFSKKKYVDASGKQITQADFTAAIKKEEENLAKGYHLQTAQLEKATKELENFENALKQIQQTQGTEKTQQIVDLQNSQNAAAQAMSGAFTEADKAIGENEVENIQNVTDAYKKQSGAIGKAVKQFAVYRIVMGFVKKALNEAVKTVRDLDKSLTEQAMVTGKTREQTYALLKSYQNLASQLGSTSKEVAEVATQFMRQGKTTADALKLTEAAISAAKVAGISATDSVQYLTTALNGFQLAATDAMKVSDRFAAIAANSATSYEEIAIALSKVASQANLAGMSIDYTTALLSKGLETTREAPETIGTALKTVIARMRELSDYGETLDDSIDVNNVETQLAYVGIALKNQQGELRSTEDVLDDLGRKWDELSANQQAAVAKALAGTRQQSRLIAMMTDYDRVLELEEISLRSAGATSAQMGVYLEGMEAAINKISVAWERVVSAFTDSDVVINLTNIVATIVDGFGAMLENSFGMIAVTTVLAGIGFNILNNKVKEWEINKLQQKVQLEQQQIELKTNITKQKQLVLDLKSTQKEKEKTLELKRQQLAEAKKLVIATKEQVIKGQATQADVLAAEALEREAELEVDKAEAEAQRLEIETQKLNIMENQNTLLENQSGLVGGLTSSLSGMLLPLTGIIKLYKSMAAAIGGVIAKRKAETAAAEKAMVANAGNSAAQIPVAGWVIAGLIIAGGLAALATGMALMANAVNTKSISEQIDELSNSIYKTTQSTTALRQGLSTFDSLNNKLIKTTEISEQMSSALDNAADKLNSDQKEIYNSFDTIEDKARYLNQVLKEQEEELEKTRATQLELIKSNPDLLVGTDATSVKAQSAVKALANNALYKEFDKVFANNMSANATAVEKLTQSLIGAMDAEKALKLVEDPTKIQDILNSLKGTNIANAMLGDDKSIQEKVEAYRDAMKVLTGDARDAFQELYKDIAFFANNGWDTTFEYLDKFGIKTTEINNINDAFLELGQSSEKAGKSVKSMFEDLAQGATIEQALRNLGLAGEEFIKVLNAYEKIAGITMLDAGQQADKLLNSVSNIYEKASKWNEMTQSERTQFLSDNAQLFKQDEELWDAFQEGNYDRIQDALLNSENLMNMFTEAREQLEQQVEIERARLAEDPDADDTYLKYLLDQLETTYGAFENFTQASLKLRLDQQNQALEAYKKYLQDQNDAEVESLNKRKEAYQNYFDAINQEQEDEEYEESANQLISNISKIGASSDAASMKQQAELEKQLADLENDRLKELRQRAQEEVIKSIDDQVERMNNTLDELLDNNRALLEAMTGELNRDATALMTSMAAANYAGGATDLQQQEYIQGLQSTFSPFTGNLGWGEIQNNSTSMSLNVTGQTINLSSEQQQNLSQVIFEALKQMGVSV